MGEDIYAEYCLAEQESTFQIPGDLSFDEAACIPECFFTAWSNLVQRGKLIKKQKVLIHGGTGNHIKGMQYKLLKHLTHKHNNNCGK